MYHSCVLGYRLDTHRIRVLGYTVESKIIGNGFQILCLIINVLLPRLVNMILMNEFNAQ